MELASCGDGAHLDKIEFFGEKIPVKYIESMDVTEGVRCDVYKFIGDSSKDLGVIFVEPGYKTPLQKVLKGDKTIESFVNGKGSLVVTDVNGGERIYEVDDKSGEFSVEVKVGEKMQWKAAPDSRLRVNEICYPPYEDGRYENLVEV